MQTNFTLAQLLDPQVAESEKILRTCVHCGFCTATCPTYVLLGDELDSPRGRIYLIKDMLEQSSPATREVVKHIDRCLSCLACMTTCPSGVHYMHLVDHAREHIENTYKRPIADRAMRGLLARVLSNPGLFRLAVVAGLIAKPFAPVLSALGLKRMAAMLRLTPSRRLAPPVDRVGKVYAAVGERRGRVALLNGCIGPVLAPSTNDAAIRLLNRNGIEVVVAAGEACCGSLAHHMGREEQALAQARNNIDAWTREIDGAGLDAILITVSGCGTAVKDYGFMLRGDADYADKAARVSAAGQGRDRISGDPRFAGRLPRRGRSASPITRLVRCSTGRRSRRRRKICFASSDSWSKMCRKGICAAARRAPTTFCSRRWRRGCATARSAISNGLSRM